MNAFALVILCLAVAAASASHLGYGYLAHDLHDVHVHHHNPAAHIPSGSIGVSHDGGAVIAGPSGSVHTSNGHHGSSAVLSGPAGEVGTHGGHAHLVGPGIEHHDHHAYAAPVVHYAAPVHVLHHDFDHHGYDHHGYDHHGYGHDYLGYGHGW